MVGTMHPMSSVHEIDIGYILTHIYSFFRTGNQIEKAGRVGVRGKTRLFRIASDFAKIEA
jgi:hypothetical protein